MEKRIALIPTNWSSAPAQREIKSSGRCFFSFFLFQLSSFLQQSLCLLPPPPPTPPPSTPPPTVVTPPTIFSLSGCVFYRIHCLYAEISIASLLGSQSPFCQALYHYFAGISISPCQEFWQDLNHFVGTWITFLRDCVSLQLSKSFCCLDINRFFA